MGEVEEGKQEEEDKAQQARSSLKTDTHQQARWMVGKQSDGTMARLVHTNEPLLLTIRLSDYERELACLEPCTLTDPDFSPVSTTDKQR